MTPAFARDLMQSSPVTLAPDTPVLAAVHLFVAAQIASAPVLDADAVVGMVSTTDLLRAIDQACDEDLDDGEEPGVAPADLGRLVVRDVMTPAPVWVAPDATVEEAARLMRKHHVHALLVGAGGALAGILAAFDLLRAIR